MAKVYAVKKGKATGIFYDWDKCNQSVKGFKGAEYKSFKTEAEAYQYLGVIPEKEGGASLVPVEEQYMSEAQNTITVATNKFNLNDTSCIAFVDGSFDKVTGYYGFGAVVITKDHVYELCGCDNQPYLACMNNIAGELLATLQAIYKAEELGMQNILIYHDLEGIGKWGAKTGAWKTNKQGTFEYREFVCNHRLNIDIDFSWVKGHSNNYYNDKADELARQGIVKQIVCDSSSIFKDIRG